MAKYFAALAFLLVGCTLSVWSVPVESESSKAEEAEKPNKEDMTKGQFSLPSFLQVARPGGWGPGAGGPPGPPVVFGNASTQGDVQGLFAHNENSLFVVSNTQDRPAVANMTSTAAYFAVPINETNSDVTDSSTASQNLAGFTVTAQEDTQAYAEGDYIQFINHGASYATGWGDSNANGTTYNPGPAPPPPQNTGSGWKAPSKPKAEEEKN